jgi:hypothetical protein
MHLVFRKVGGVEARRVARRIRAPLGPAHGDIVYNGGPTIACPRIHATFWGPTWSDLTHQAQAQRLLQFLKDMPASDWMNILSQYGGGTGKNSAVLESNSFVADVSGTLTDEDIQGTLQAAINSGTIPAPPSQNTSKVVIIFLDESVEVKDDNTAVMCEPTGDNAFGYHSSFTTNNGNKCYYAVIPALDNSCIVNSCPCQNQIGSNTTSSSPFVTSDGWVYFQGTDDKLWKVFNDGSQQSQIGGNTTKSTPFVTSDGWVYFQGTDDKLWKVFNDGSQQSQIGGNTTNSTPFVTSDGWVYFQGTDDKLWKVFNDGSQQSQIGGNTTKSSPFVTPDGWVWFQGTDDRLWKVFNDGSQQSQPGNNTTASSPTVLGDWVYFQGTDNKLWQMATDGSQQINLGGNTTASTPAVTADSVYFQGTDDALWRYFLGLTIVAMNNIKKIWTTVGSAGTLNQTDLAKVSLHQSIIQLATGAPSSSEAIVRYNLTPVDGVFFLGNFRYGLQIRFRGKIVAKLMEVDLANGTETQLILFDSSKFPRSPAFQVQIASMQQDSPLLDFVNKAYYVEAALKPAALVAGHPSAISMIKLLAQADFTA